MMTRYECEFEAEVLAAVVQSRWPHHVDQELRQHASACAICSDVAKVAAAIDSDQEQLRVEAKAAVPDWSSVWWKAQLRARREAIKTAGRPITAVQVVAFGATVAVLGACFGATSAWFQQLLQSIPVAALFADHAPLIIGTGVLMVLVPALCLALVRD